MPFAVKFGVAALVSVGLCRDKYLKTIYDPDLYRLALKYRSFYDSDYQSMA